MDADNGSAKVKAKAKVGTDWVYLIPIALVSIAVMWFTHDKRLNLLDEGFIVTASERVARGELPYRDFFTLLMPGTFCLHAILFRLFGTSLMVGRIVVLVVGSLLPVLVFACARTLLPRPYALAAGFLACAWGVGYGWVLPTYSWYGSIVSLFALYLALGVPVGEWDTRKGAVIGAVLGLAFLFKQNFGVFAALAIAVYIMVFGSSDPRKRARVIGALTAGAVAVNLPFIAWVALGGGLADMVTDILLVPIGPFRNGMALPYPLQWPSLPESGATWNNAVALGRALLPWVPFSYPLYAMALLCGSVRRRSVSEPREVLLLLFAGLVFLCAFPRADSSHIQFTLPAGYIVLMALIRRVAIGAWSGPLTAVVIAIPMVASGFTDIRAWNSGCTEELIGVPKARGIRMQPWEAEQTRSVLEGLDGLTRRGEPILVAPWAAMFYFLSDRPNPTRYDLLIPGNHPEGAEDEIIGDMESEKPTHVVHGFVWDVDGKRFQDYLPDLHAYIRSHYSPVGWMGQYEFLRRNSPTS